MRLLFLTPQLPYPPRQGTAIRNWGLMEQLAARHAITLLSFVETGQDADAPILRQTCARVLTVAAPTRTPIQRLRTLASPHADLARRLWSAEFAQVLAQCLHENTFDVVQIEGLEMAAYLPLVRANGTRTVYDAHNAEHLIQQRALNTDWQQPRRWPAALYSALQVPRLRAFEKQVCANVEAVTCVSTEDAAALQTLLPTLRPSIVPNGLDLATYHLNTAPSAHQIVFTGKMDYRPNLDAALWFIETVWPRLREARGDLEFIVVGQKPPAALQQWHGRNGITITGAVEEVRPYIARAAVYVAPLRMGGGTRFKLLEAMALARPIVSTRIGAEGFAVEDGRELRLADTPSAFAEAVLGLLNDPARAQALGQTGLAFVRAGYDWGAIVPQLERVYQKLTLRR